MLKVKSEGKANAILTAISSVRTEFSARFDNVVEVIENIRKDINDCAERVTQAEQRLSGAEDELASLRTIWNPGIQFLGQDSRLGNQAE